MCPNRASGDPAARRRECGCCIRRRLNACTGRWGSAGGYEPCLILRRLRAQRQNHKRLPDRDREAERRRDFACSSSTACARQGSVWLLVMTTLKSSPPIHLIAPRNASKMQAVKILIARISAASIASILAKSGSCRFLPTALISSALMRECADQR